MKAVKVIALLLTNVLLAGLIPIVIIVQSLHATVLKPYSWNAYFTNQANVEALSKAIPAEMDGKTLTSGGQEETALKTAIHAAASEVVTDQWIKTKISRVQSEIWDYILHKQKTIQEMAIPKLHNAVVEQFRQQANQLKLTSEQKQKMISQINNNVPKQINLAQFVGLNEHKLNMVRNVYDQSVAKGSIFFKYSVLLLLIGLVLTFYLQFMLRWFGFTLGLTGWLLFFILLGISHLHPTQYVNVSIPLGSLKTSVQQMMEQMAGSAFNQMMAYARNIAIIGTLLVIISFFLSRADTLMRDRIEMIRWIRWTRAGIVLVLVLVCALLASSYLMI